MKRIFFLLYLMLIIGALTACAAAPVIPTGVEPGQIRFNAERAFALETEFATTFLNRHSGSQANRDATEWVKKQFETRGWTCRFDDWEVVLYSKDTPLRNVVCSLKGQDPREILLVAHHDIAPTTLQGADNDASGIAALLELAEIFAGEGPPRYGLVFVSTDAEEYGMMGSLRFVETHPNPENFIAGLSLDNLGRSYYDGMKVEMLGQGQYYSPIWIVLLAREAARASGSPWDVYPRLPIDQVIDQAAPVSLMDQGPMVAAGIPAVGFSGREQFGPRPLPDPDCAVRPDLDNYNVLHYELWHRPEDSLACQSVEALGQSGVLAEAFIRQLQSMDTFPQESGPYIFLDSSQQVFRGLPLWLILVALAGVFLAGSLRAGKSQLRETLAGWRQALPHFLSLWLPLIAGVVLLYLFVKIPWLLLDFEKYPATTKDPYLIDPPWLRATLLFLLGLVFFFVISRWGLKKTVRGPAPSFPQLKSFGLLVVGLVGVYILFRNPFSLLFIVPALFWLLIGGRRGFGYLLDLLLFLLGGLLLYAMIYIQGFQVLRYGWAFLWMMLNMIAVQMFGLATMLASTAVIAGGLVMVVRPPGDK